MPFLTCQNTKFSVYLNPIVKKTIVFLILLFSTNFIFSNEITAGDFSMFKPDSLIIEAFEKGETMSDEDFMYYAFTLSEIAETNIPRYMEHYKLLATKLERELSSLTLSDFDKGELILQYLHTSLFKRYQEPVTNLNALFDRGIYNCVSSSIVYYALAERFGLQVHGVKTADHAFCSIRINGAITDVETTSLYGFNPGEKKEFANSFGQTGFVYTPPSNYRDRTNIGKLAMLSLILQNAIVELYKTERYEAVVRHAVNIHGLLQTSGSFDAMVNEFSNYATYLDKRNRFSEGIEFFTNAAEFYGRNSQFEELAGILFNNAVATELAYRSIHQLKQNIPGAQKFFNTYKEASVVPRDVVATTQKMLDEAVLRIFVEDNRFESSVTEVKKYYNENRIPQSMYNDLLMYVYSKEINSLMGKKEWEEALLIAKKAIEDTIRDSRATTQLQAVEHNIGVSYHNEFATLYNRQSFVEAAKKVNEGLAIVPNNKTLQNDKKTLQSLY